MSNESVRLITKAQLDEYKKLEEENAKLKKKLDDLRKGLIDSKTISMFFQKGWDSGTEVKCKELISKCSRLEDENFELDQKIHELKEVVEECRKYIETEQKMLVKCTPHYKKLMEELLTEIDEVLG